ECGGHAPHAGYAGRRRAHRHCGSPPEGHQEQQAVLGEPEGRVERGMSRKPSRVEASESALDLREEERAFTQQLQDFSQISLIVALNGHAGGAKRALLELSQAIDQMTDTSVLIPTQKPYSQEEAIQAWVVAG